jgi:Protein of unknown function (DUF2934)
MSVSMLAREPRHDKLSGKGRIRRRAHELYVQRGSQSGSELDDWLRAEAEILRAQDAAIDEAPRSLFQPVMRRPIKTGPRNHHSSFAVPQGEGRTVSVGAPQSAILRSKFRHG